MRRGGTNPTAAAVGVFQLLDRTGVIPANVADFLAPMPSIEGGFRANARAPAADLLSTFTGVWTMDQLGAADRIDSEACLALCSIFGPARRRFPRRPVGQPQRRGIHFLWSWCTGPLV